MNIKFGFLAIANASSMLLILKEQKVLTFKMFQISFSNVPTAKPYDVSLAGVYYDVNCYRCMYA